MESPNSNNESQKSDSDEFLTPDNGKTSPEEGNHSRRTKGETGSAADAFSARAKEVAKEALKRGAPSPIEASAMYKRAVREELKELARPTAERIALTNNFPYLSSATTATMYNDAVRDALTAPARQVAEQVAKLHDSSYLSNFTASTMYNDAVRDALNGPARQIAEQVAKTHDTSYLSNFTTGTMYNDAVRDALDGSAKQVAEKIRKSSFAWLENYSRQALEPGLFAEVAHVLASDELDSKDSDYAPLSFDKVEQEHISAPREIFERYEIVVKSLRGMLSQMETLSGRSEPLNIVWRGQADADWALVSSLYRNVESQNIKLLKSSPNSEISNSVPTESQVLKAESYLLSQIRDRWRLGSTSGIELLTRMQHRGVPTRLIDATRNPLLAIWFAVSNLSDEDARVFAIAHHPIPATHDPQAASAQRQLWATHEPFWLGFNSPEDQVINAWGTGTRLRELVPPDYDKRILAQNAVFLLDGLPTLTDSLLSNFNSFAKSDWTAADLARSMSIVLAPADPTDRRNKRDNPLSRVYSFRIPAKLKEPIKNTLKTTYGLDWEVVYPDIDGIGYYINNNPNWIEESMRQ